MRHFEELPDTAHQQGQRGRRPRAAVARYRRSDVGAARQGQADLVGNARPVMHQPGECGLADLVGDHERQRPRRSRFAGAGEQARFAEIVARRQAAELDVAGTEF